MELLVGFKSDYASSIIAAGRGHITRCYGSLETRRGQAQFPVTFISMFNLSSLSCKSSVDLILLKDISKSCNIPANECKTCTFSKRKCVG